MNVQLVLINQETGEPIYETVTTSEAILAQGGDTLLYDHADAMRSALVKYKPRQFVGRPTQDPPVEPTEVDITGMGQKRANFVITDDMIDNSADDFGMGS
jgi:hypothetical protein